MIHESRPFYDDDDDEVAQSCPTLCDPVDCSLLGFSIHRILQARILEWVAISFSRAKVPILLLKSKIFFYSKIL